MSTEMKVFNALHTAGALAAITLMIVIGHADIYDAEQQQARYCSMVKEFKDTSGANGWPDYNGNYEQICNGDKKRVK